MLCAFKIVRSVFQVKTRISYLCSHIIGNIKNFSAMNEMLEKLKHYFKTTPRSVIENEWNDLGEAYGNVGPKLDEFLLIEKDSLGTCNKDVRKPKARF